MSVALQETDFRDCTAASPARWLQVATRVGALDVLISLMAKKAELPHWGSKSAVNRAGTALRTHSVTEQQLLVLEAWRMEHRKVIHAFEALLRARAKSKPIQVAQRLKRRWTITDKLSRYPNMELARMDDVAGCRLIFNSIEELHEFRKKVHRGKFKHILKNGKDKYDYLVSPTARGYRGVHDVYEYRARKGKSRRPNGLLIEIQYRTTVQHAWATAVEVITQMTGNEPKFDRGDKRHIRFFCVISEMLARVHEGMNSCLSELSNDELIAEHDKLENEINVMSMLANLIMHKWVGDRADSDHVILQISKNGDLKLHQYDLELEASKALLELERDFPQDDVVLVGAKTAAELTSAFRNYFYDVGEFLGLVMAADKMLRTIPNETTQEQAPTN